MTPTLEVVEQLVDQLSEQDQMALVKRLGIKFLALPPDVPLQTRDRSEAHAKRLQLAEQLLAEVEGLPDDEPGILDVTEEIRRMNAEHHR